MGQQNMSYAGPMLDAQPQQVHHHPGNRTTYNPRYLPENHGQFPYMNSQHNCEHCNTHMTPSPSTSVFSAPVNHDYFPFSNNHQIFERNRSLYMDGPNNVYKRSGSSVTVPMNSDGNRATGAMGFDFDPMVVRNRHHLVRDGQVVQAVPAGSSWNHAHGVPYLQDTGVHGFQVAGVSRTRNSPALIPPHPMRPHQGSHNGYYPPLPPPSLPLPPPPPMLPVQTQRRSTRTSIIYPDPGPSFVGPTMPHGVMLYRARRQQVMIDTISRRRSFRQLQVLQEEAILALSEQMGIADSGLSDKCISDRLKPRTFATFRHHSEDESADEEPNLCVICQMEFEDQEKIGMLDCCHEYHVECIKKWLIVKNNCPVCKKTAFH